MSHQENPYPVDPTGPLTIGGIPDAELGPLFDALPADPNKHIERLRSAIADVDPASLTGADTRALPGPVAGGLRSQDGRRQVSSADEPYTYRDALFPEDRALVRIANGPVFEGRTFVAIGVVATDEDDGETSDAVVLLDGGTAVVMALDMLSAASQAIRKDPGPFQGITQADLDAANAALRVRLGGEQ